MTDAFSVIPVLYADWTYLDKNDFSSIVSYRFVYHRKFLKYLLNGLQYLTQTKQNMSTKYSLQARNSELVMQNGQCKLISHAAYRFNGITNTQRVQLLS